ncbi:MAG: septum formation initiator family protein [Candidatus Paceibacteria bacterium]
MAKSKRTQKKRSKTKKSPFWTGIGAICLLALIGWTSFSLYHTYTQRRAVEQQKQEFKETISRLKHKNKNLKELKAYYSTNTYRQRQARKKLNVQRKDEQAVAVPPKSIDTSSYSDINKEARLIRILRKDDAYNQISPDTNIEKWWAFFFDKDRFPDSSSS